MESAKTVKIYTKAELFLSEEPEWDTLAAALQLFRREQRTRIEFQRAYTRDGNYILPIYIEKRLSLVEREEGKRIELTSEEAKARFFEKARDEIEGFFGCHVEFTELIGDYLHPEDVAEINEGFSRRSGGMFGFRSELGGEDIRPEQPKKSVDDPFEELNDLVALDSIKKQIRELAELVEKHGKEALPCLHMVFRGNPGTGKTTVARIIAKIFDNAGITNGEGIFVETDRSGLVGQYVGHTASKTKHVLKKAKGGALFIDEAYALAAYEGGRDYGPEAVATLVKALEDDRDEFICIMAGYPREMDKLILMNPGLRDRIGFYIDFPDYTASELCDVFGRFAKNAGLKTSKAAKEELLCIMKMIVASKGEDFSNARMARKIFERVRMDHLLKVGGKTIEKESIERVFESEDMKSLLGNSDHSFGFVA